MINLDKLFKSRLTQVNHIIETVWKIKKHNDMIIQENQTDKKRRDDLT